MQKQTAQAVTWVGTMRRIAGAHRKSIGKRSHVSLLKCRDEQASCPTFPAAKDAENAYPVTLLAHLMLALYPYFSSLPVERLFFSGFECLRLAEMRTTPPATKPHVATRCSKL
jgi:hypothetical protein